jgi:hypothetical protein
VKLFATAGLAVKESYNLQDLATGKRLYDSTSLNCPIYLAKMDKFCTKIEHAKDSLGIFSDLW